MEAWITEDRTFSTTGPSLEFQWDPLGVRQYSWFVRKWKLTSNDARH